MKGLYSDFFLLKVYQHTLTVTQFQPRPMILWWICDDLVKKLGQVSHNDESGIGTDKWCNLRGLQTIQASPKSYIRCQVHTFIKVHLPVPVIIPNLPLGDVNISIIGICILVQLFTEVLILHIITIWTFKLRFMCGGRRRIIQGGQVSSKFLTSHTCKLHTII